MGYGPLLAETAENVKPLYASDMKANKKNGFNRSPVILVTFWCNLESYLQFIKHFVQYM